MSTSAQLSFRAAQFATAWSAARVVLSSAAGSGQASSSGGALASRLDQYGVGALGAALSDGERVELQDAGATVVLTRHGASGALRISWADGPTYEQRVPLPGQLAGATAPSRPVPVPAADGPLGPPTDLSALGDLNRPLAVVRGVLYDWDTVVQRQGTIPAVSVDLLGDPLFLRDHGVRAAYVAGAMAGGIASVDLVVAMANAGLLAFFGSGGLPLPAVEKALQTLSSRLKDRPWGCNLLHNPNEPAMEEQTVDLFLRHGCSRISASAYMTLTPAVVRYRAAGLSMKGGQIVERTSIFAKVSRPEVAARFLAPAPMEMLQALVASGKITDEQARLAAQVPLARDVTAEADSGGHTDRRPLLVLLPLLLRLRDELQIKHAYTQPPRIGAAGGLGDPRSIHAAFAMGAAYVLTGSVNQATVEAGTSLRVKEMLVEAGMADVATGPAPDMFELGAHVQVLSKGSMYAQRGRRLYDLYKTYEGVDSLPAKVRARLESKIFRRSIDDIWAGTRAYWAERDPSEVARAERDPKHHMALIFRWYLGMTSRWARSGEVERVRDYQVWCGPSMGLFNAWSQDTPLAELSSRKVADVAQALLEGAAACRRIGVARALGVRI